MIIVRLIGGLGNQLFQYALGRRLALERGVPLKLDLSWFQVQSLRHYMLDRFKIDAEIATPDEIAYLTRSNGKGIPNLLYKMGEKFVPYYRRTVVREVKRSFDPRILKVKPSAQLIGYWQSERYFKEIESHLRQELSLKQPLSSQSANIARQMQGSNSISLHVRRQDYVSSARRIQVYGVCSLEYYQRAVEYLRKNVPNPHFFVFSDDVTWAGSNLTFLAPMVEVIEVDGPARDEEELILMSRCKHHILANSSFSWWAAWIGTTPGTVVVAPRQWIRDPRRENPDIAPAAWVRM